jgi:hypothetical protein
VLQHGVPVSLKNDRSMFGFRDFVIGSVYFKSGNEDKNFQVGNYISGKTSLMSKDEIKEKVFGCNIK